MGDRESEMGDRESKMEDRESKMGDGAEPREVVANGKRVAAAVPCTVEEFLLHEGLLPRSVVVEHNGEAIAPSQFGSRILKAGDRLEIVKVVAGG